MVFERFTDRARRVVVLAQNDARQLGHATIEPAHLFLALLEEGTGVASRAMTAVGVDPVALRARVSAAFDVTDERKRAERVPFGPKTKKVLELSLREALQLGHSYIGTEHLLLGALRLAATDDPASDEVLGVPERRLRKEVLTTMSGSSRTGGDRFSFLPGDRLSPALALALETGRALAGRDTSTTGHLLLAMLDDPESQAARALASVGATREVVARAVHEVPVDGSSDAPSDVVEVHVGGRRFRVADAELVTKLSSASTEEILGALRHLGDDA